MPLIASAYSPPWPLRNGHIQTIYPSFFRKNDRLAYIRERINTLDGDFLDLDWVKKDASKVAILSHGLEGNTGSTYIRGMANFLQRHGWDVLAWNFRGCSGAPPRF